MYLCNIDDAAILCICSTLDMIADDIIFIICCFAFQISVKLPYVNSERNIFRNTIGYIRILLLDSIRKSKVTYNSDGSRQKQNQAD